MITRRGSWPWGVTLAVLALAGSLGADLPTLAHVAYVLLLLLVLCFLYASISVRMLRLEHRVAVTRAVVGERVLEVYRVRTRALWPIYNVGVDGRGGVSGERPRWVLALAPRGREDLTSVHIAVARGRFALGATRLTVTDPFGLVVARRDCPAQGEIIVWPRARIVEEFSLAAARAGDLLPARRSWASMPVSGAVRPFAAGDPSTRIHWLSTVRHGALMVKNSDQSVGQRLWVALDLSSPAHVGAGDESTSEYGVEAAAYVVELAYNAGLDVGLIVAGTRTGVIEPRRGHEQRAYLLDLLAVAQAGPGESLAVVLEERRAVRPSDAVVILTPNLSGELLDLSARYRRLGCGVGVVLVDGAGFGGPDTVQSGAAQLAAERIPVYVVSGERAWSA